MRTNIVIDDALMAEALESSGLKTKKEVVEQALKLLIQKSRQQAIRELRGRLKWEGDLDEMRGGL
jgi:Arc/MetJ family transcription regulator